MKVEPPHDKTNIMTVRPAKTQISLGIHSKDSDQTGWMPRLIWVFAGLTVILLVLTWGGSIYFLRLLDYRKKKVYMWLEILFHIYL